MSRFEELIGISDGREVGVLRWNRSRDRLAFSYAESWLANPQAFPISLGIPLSGMEYADREVAPWIAGLLPDNNDVLEEWARRFRVSARNPFRLLQHVGEDCAGGIQFITPDRLEKFGLEHGSVDWLSSSDLELRIDDLMKNHGATRSDENEGQFSLAGAQPKTAFLWDGERERWGVPSGSVPTTHILKPCGTDLVGHAENEHFCLRLARHLGFKTVDSRVSRIGEHSVIIVRRYDRIPAREGKIYRVHQEDLCQSMGFPPQMKYQSDGGPGPSGIIGHLLSNSSGPSDDKERFIDALIFNYLIGGTDAHAKNYSILIAPGGQVRLAPLYDVASIFPYPRRYNPHKSKLAMKIGGSYRFSKIGTDAWRKAAAEWQVEESGLLERIREIAGNLVDAAVAVREELNDEDLDHAILDDLSARIAENASVEERRFSPPTG